MGRKLGKRWQKHKRVISAEAREILRSVDRLAYTLDLHEYINTFAPNTEAVVRLTEKIAKQSAQARILNADEVHREKDAN